MKTNPVRRRILVFLRHFPWLFYIGHRFWRLFQAKYSVGAVGVVFNDEGKVLLVEHAFHAKYAWGLPGGWVDRHEDPAMTVRRELLEELSLDVEVGPILLVETPFRYHLDLAYLCRPLGKVGTLNYELLDYGWFDTENLPKMLSVHHRAVTRALEMTHHTGYDP